MKILAFLQNMWFKNPVYWEKAFAKAEAEGYRNRLIHDLLFFRCLTGRRLTAVFGEALCGQIIWEEASRQIGGKASAAFPADPQHMFTALQKHRPQIVLLFGNIAHDGWGKLLQNYFTYVPGENPHRLAADHIIVGPHPAARGAKTIPDLRHMHDMLASVYFRTPEAA